MKQKLCGILEVDCKMTAVEKKEAIFPDEIIGLLPSEFDRFKD